MTPRVALRNRGGTIRSERWALAPERPKKFCAEFSGKDAPKESSGCVILGLLLPVLYALQIRLRDLRGKKVSGLRSTPFLAEPLSRRERHKPKVFSAPLRLSEIMPFSRYMRNGRRKI